MQDQLPVDGARLEAILQSMHVKVNRKKMAGNDALSSVRSYYSASNHTLFLNKGLSRAQENFLLAREAGFQFLAVFRKAL